MREFLEKRKAGLKSLTRELRRAVVSIASAIFVRLPMYIYGHKRAFALMLVSSILLLAGFTRLYDYTTPMLRGDWSEAGKYKYHLDFDEVDPTEPKPDPTMIVEDSVLDKVVKLSIISANRFCDFVVGDRVPARYNNGLTLYRETNYSEAIVKLNNAYRSLGDGSGGIKPGYRRRAAELQFLIGNAYANLQKTDEAVQAYQLSLQFNPNDQITIYNLERLLSSGGGKGGQGDKPKSANPNKTKL